METRTSAGIILFAHGARDPQWAEPFERIRLAVAHRSPATPVALAFLESMQPPLADAVKELSERGVGHITLVPLFMAQGGHLKRDLPVLVQRIRSEHPGLSIHVTPAIGDAEPLIAAIAEWVAQCALQAQSNS